MHWTWIRHCEICLGSEYTRPTRTSPGQAADIANVFSLSAKYFKVPSVYPSYTAASFYKSTETSVAWKVANCYSILTMDAWLSVWYSELFPAPGREALLPPLLSSFKETALSKAHCSSSPSALSLHRALPFSTSLDMRPTQPTLQSKAWLE